MSGALDMITGKAAKKAAKQQKQAQALAEQQTKVAQTRQLSEQAFETARTGLVRRNPRGRRLFADASASALPSVIA